VLAAVAGGAAWWWKQDESRHAHAATAAATANHEGSAQHEAPGGSGAPVRVEVVHPQRGGMVRTSSQPGSVHWFESAELFSKTSGYLKELSVDIGDRVKQGDLLAVIDNPEVIEEAARAEAALMQAKAAVVQAEARVKTAKADLEAAKAMVLKARADIERFVSERHYREQQLKRYKGLLAKQAVPQEVVDEYQEHFAAALAAEHSAEAEVETAKARATSADAMVAQAEADLAEAKANVEVAQSNLDKAKVFVSYTRIMSPYSGVVTFRGYHRGDFIRSAEGASVERPILTVGRTDKVRVITYIPDLDVPFTSVGDKARLRLNALPDEVFEGTVTRFAETEDEQSRTMRTEVDLPNPDDRLRAGMYGELTIVLDESTRNLTIPTASLASTGTQGEASVFVVRDGHVHKRNVKIGGDDGLRVEIRSGLTAEDAVVKNPGQVSEGYSAEAVETPANVAAGAGS
jgi:RND family efflux transporter MFP subunit